MSIGVAKVSEVRSVTDTETTTFAGQTVTGSDTLAMVTWGGDAVSGYEWFAAGVVLTGVVVLLTARR